MAHDQSELVDRVIALECAFKALLHVAAGSDPRIPAEIAQFLGEMQSGMRDNDMDGLADALTRLRSMAERAVAAAVHHRR